MWFSDAGPMKVVPRTPGPASANLQGRCYGASGEGYGTFGAVQQRPSRMAAAFCCIDEPQARAYQAKVDPNRIQLLHAVELVDPTMTTHIAPLSMVDFPPARSTFIDQTFARATAYWTGLPQGDQEVITASPLRVTANID
jgi:hypothetical protein